MNAASAEIFMRCHRPWLRAEDDPRIAKALRAAERDPALKAQLASQLQLDEQCQRAIGDIQPPADLAARIAAIPAHEEERGFDFKTFARQPAFLAIVIALVVFLGWGIYAAMMRMEDFPGREDVERMVEINDTTTGADFQIKAAEIGNLADWMFSKYGFESFYVPPQFASAKTVGCRVFKQDDLPVAQFAIDQNDMLFYMFKADDFGVKIEPADHWRIFKDDAWVAAVQQHGENCFMIAFRGGKRDMERVVQGAQ